MKFLLVFLLLLNCQFANAQDTLVDFAKPSDAAVICENGYQGYHSDFPGKYDSCGMMTIYGTNVYELYVAIARYLNDSLYATGYLVPQPQFKRFLFFKRSDGFQLVRDGHWNFYFINGAVRKKTSYKDGRKEGLSVYFDRDGKVLRYEKYVNDQRVSD